MIEGDTPDAPRSHKMHRNYYPRGCSATAKNTSKLLHQKLRTRKKCIESAPPDAPRPQQQDRSCSPGCSAPAEMFIEPVSLDAPHRQKMHQSCSPGCSMTSSTLPPRGPCARKQCIEVDPWRLRDRKECIEDDNPDAPRPQKMHQS